MPKDNVVVGIDIGSTKISTIIATLEEENINIIGASSTIECTFGTAPMPFMVLPTNEVTTVFMPTGVTKDHIPFVNILPFALCTSLANPAVAAATAAALGVLTPMPCTPVPTGDWVPGTPTVEIGGAPSIDETCTLSCAFGGVISFITPGQAITIIP